MKSARSELALATAIAVVTVSAHRQDHACAIQDLQALLVQTLPARRAAVAMVSVIASLMSVHVRKVMVATTVPSAHALQIAILPMAVVPVMVRREGVAVKTAGVARSVTSGLLHTLLVHSSAWIRALNSAVRKVLPSRMASTRMSASTNAIRSAIHLVLRSVR